MKYIATINPEKVTETEAQAFEHRIAARGVVFDNEENIGLLYVSQRNYHKLPGGGIDPGETIEEGFVRECLEELGVNVLIEKSLGTIAEYVKQYTQLNISHGFVARVIGEKGEPTFTNHEIARGFRVMWAPLDQALEIIKKDRETVEDYKGKLITARDEVFLTKVQ